MRSLLLALICALVAGCNTGSDAPSPGTLDPDFGAQGKVTTPMGTGNDTAVAVAIQADGKIVAVGVSETGYQDMAIVRYNSDGSLDTSFGTGGKVNLDVDGGHDIAQGVALQPDGKIVVAGDAAVGGLVRVALVRFTTTGTLDASFDGDGIVIGDVANAHAIALQPDGKIVVAGSFNNGMTSWRYNADGSPDSTFDSDGRATVSIGTGGSQAWSVAIQPDGKIVLGGHAVNGAYPDFAVARFNGDGSLDTGFGTGGFQITDTTGTFDWGKSLALQPDGKIILAGSGVDSSGFVFVAVRYGSDGTLDPAFGVGGIVTTRMGLGGEAEGSAIQADGKVILVGFAANTVDQDVGLARYYGDGVLDGDFGSDGRVMTAIGAGHDHVMAVAIDADGKLVAVGFSYNDTDSDFLVARYFN